MREVRDDCPWSEHQLFHAGHTLARYVLESGAHEILHKCVLCMRPIVFLCTLDISTGHLNQRRKLTTVAVILMSEAVQRCAKLAFCRDARNKQQNNTRSVTASSFVDDTHIWSSLDMSTLDLKFLPLCADTGIASNNSPHTPDKTESCAAVVRTLVLINIIDTAYNTLTCRITCRYN